VSGQLQASATLPILEGSDGGVIEATSQNSREGTEESHENPQSVKLVSQPRSEPSTSRMRVQSNTAMPKLLCSKGFRKTDWRTDGQKGRRRPDWRDLRMGSWREVLIPQWQAYRVFEVNRALNGQRGITQASKLPAWVTSSWAQTSQNSGLRIAFMKPDTMGKVILSKATGMLWHSDNSNVLQMLRLLFREPLPFLLPQDTHHSNTNKLGNVCKA
jgi:hypothetical protein